MKTLRSSSDFAADFADSPDVAVPQVFWETTTSRVLTLERMHGIRVDDLPALDAAGIRHVRHVLDEPLDAPLRTLFAPQGRG